MIAFKYRLPNTLIPLMSTINNYSDEYVYGIVDEGIISDLKHCSMYLICETEDIDNKIIYKNPFIVIEKNQQKAIVTYYDFTHHDNGSVVCEILNRCDNIKVERA